jgi:trans-2,3-dihydro-3-hydroxyanthranilate isomerase
MAIYAYETVDVFTSTRFGGNPLAVILDARGLSDAAMQQIAAEFGYSETTFVLPPPTEDVTAEVRIFTPTAEVPFAGHPNVGTAFVLARAGAVFGKPVGDAMRFAERAGMVDVRILRAGAIVSGATITAPRPLAIGRQIRVELVAACVALVPELICTTIHQPCVASVGLPFVIAEVASREALARAKPDVPQITLADAEFPLSDGRFSIFLYVPDPVARDTFHARMFAPLDNVLEDPATGSASAALSALRVFLRPEPDLDVAITIHQGDNMGRPSLLNLAIHKAAGHVQRVDVGGACVPVMRGTLTLD